MRTEKLITTTMIASQKIYFWRARWPSRLCVFAQKNVAEEPERWPASTHPLHWGEIMKRVPGEPQYDVGENYWNSNFAPMLSAGTYPTTVYPFPAALFVATVGPGTIELTSEHQAMAYAALLPFDIFTAFDSSVTAKVAGLTPFRSVGVDSAFRNNCITEEIGRLVLQLAKHQGFPRVHLFNSLPSTGVIPETWRGHPCKAVAVIR